MLRKRILLNNISDLKRIKLDSNSAKDCDKNAPTNTASALSYLSTLFSVEKFQNQLPPIVMRHQIYSLINCRTEVDRCLNEMKNKGEVRFFKLGQNDDDTAVVYMKDYIEHIQKCCPKSVIDNFLSIVKKCPDISYSKHFLMEIHGLKERNITELIQQGVLTARDVGCYWLSIPKVGEFVKAFRLGRRSILMPIKKSNYKELLQSELEKRKLPQKALLGMAYHIHDIIGSDQVTCIETSTGIVLRLQL